MKDLPLVVHPHGGPIGISDHWHWNLDSQLLASQGYAVLQVNYRGSSGYGASFVGAGRHAFGTTMIDDITDGVHWAIQQGYVDAKRICIFGVSYGGYAALMSAVKEPDLYRCAIDYAGIYDWKLMKATDQVTDSNPGRKFYKEFIGETPEQLTADSPRTYIDKLKASLMIVHGKDDEIVPFSQAEALRKDLDARHYPYEWLVKNGEAHGFYNSANRSDFYFKLLAFLDKNVGSASTQPAVDTKATAAASPN